MCFVFIWEQTATCATYSINWLVFITKKKSVYCAVRTVSLNKAVCASSLKGWYCYYLRKIEAKNGWSCTFNSWCLIKNMNNVDYVVNFVTTVCIIRWYVTDDSWLENKLPWINPDNFFSFFRNLLGRTEENHIRIPSAELHTYTGLLV